MDNIVGGDSENDALKIRVLNIAATALLLIVSTLQFTKVVDGFWTMTLLLLIAAPTTVAWVILERRQGAEKMRGGGRRTESRCWLPTRGVY
ncbi:hypothetical protein [Paenarthrobacter aurescens]|uniref:Uncharacterized protein n=1 Tax=Paenarthrobacter aurescens TaxID=43663 RepID=A0A4Y3NAJ0_PAEAU|nr:hypothetical protein [Paenarthrobacter aurescens]MDO6142730.1 hypothetical protein [Paenarthrobacter aurescens]MDO6146577.1 hypothetical protein [Paenarthrobacter aurescens]MDO6157822.1 hypothetical protein [Paenarthrobacter aurescens]MDO6161807.1 hypothetical protein [Paenarthrobacter aurescens]GEB18870.1 hypothetical protein AAU01_16250 [Paenarthrobacter aurescens]